MLRFEVAAAAAALVAHIRDLLAEYHGEGAACRACGKEGVSNRRGGEAAPGSGGVRNGLIGGVRFLVTSGVFDICPYVSFDMPRTGIELVKNN